MFDTLPEAVEFARRLERRGRISKERPGVIGYTGGGIGKRPPVWYVLPRGWKWPEGFVSQMTVPESRELT